MKEVAPRGVSRRTLLKSFAAAAGLGAISDLSSDSTPGNYSYARLADRLERMPVYKAPYREKDFSYDFSLDLTPEDPTSYRYLQRESLAVMGNPRLKKPIPNKGVAYAVTHAGFIEGTVSEAATQLRLAETAHKYRPGQKDLQFFEDLAKNIVEGHMGDYEAHRNNLVRLYDFMGKSAVPSVCFYEHEVLREPDRVRPEFAVPEQAFVVATGFATGDFAPEVEIAEDAALRGFVIEQQNSCMLYDALRDAGINEVHVAGEYSFNFTDEVGCLGGTAMSLMGAGFRVRGIEGAVYPPEPPARHNHPELAAALFEDTVPMPQ